MSRPIKYLVFASLCGCVAHVLFSVILAATTSALYQHRMVNLRLIDGQTEIQSEVAGSFLLDTISDSTKPVVTIVGSSFAWGLPFVEEDTFGYHLQDELEDRYNTVNASVIGDSPQGSMQTLCALERLEVRAAVLFIEVNLANYWSGGPVFRPLETAAEHCADAYTSRGRGGSASDNPAIFRTPFRYLSFFLKNPFGLGHFKILFDKRTENVRDERDFDLNRLADNYFPTTAEFDDHLEVHRENIRDLGNIARISADRVILAISPFAEDGLGLSRFTWGEIEPQLNTLYELCLQNPDVGCFYPQAALTQAHFMDVAHLNLHGHKRYAKLLAEFITGP